MRALATPALALALALAGCAGYRDAPEAAAMARKSHEISGFGEPRPSTAEWPIEVETLGRGVGSYTISVRYDRNVAVIAEIRAAGPRHFKGTPEYDPATLGSGVTRVTALDAFPPQPPPDPVRLLTVVFRRAGPGRLAATAEIESLYDDSARGRPIPGRLTRPRFEHVFE